MNRLIQRLIWCSILPPRQIHEKVSNTTTLNYLLSICPYPRPLCLISCPITSPQDPNTSSAYCYLSLTALHLASSVNHPHIASSHAQTILVSPFSSWPPWMQLLLFPRYFSSYLITNSKKVKEGVVCWNSRPSNSPPNCWTGVLDMKMARWLKKATLKATDILNIQFSSSCHHVWSHADTNNMFCLFYLLKFESLTHGRRKGQYFMHETHFQDL